MEWVRITFLCEKLGCLPNPGGLFQQESSHLRRIEKVFQAVEQRKQDLDPSKKEESEKRLDQKVAQLEQENESQRTTTDS